MEKTLAGELNALKERVIGAEVFDRPPDYETSVDAIVRVKANEVRKRLAQYYQGTGAADALRIELPAGSYMPTLTWLDGKVIPLRVLDPHDSEIPKRLTLVSGKSAGWLARSGWRIWLALGLGTLLAAAAVVWHLAPLQPELDRFWAPMLASSEPVVVCMSVKDDFIQSERLSKALTAAAQSNHYRLDFPLERDDVVRVPNGQMSLPSLRAVLNLGMFLAEHGKLVQFRTPAEVSSDEIRHQALIFVGWFNNPWATQLNQELRYRFDTTNTGSRAVSWIRDATAPNVRKWVVDGVWPYHPQGVDYAIITRVFDSSNQRVIVAAAGMTRFGAQVAGEFLTAPKYWKAVGAQAPRDWDRMNCQIVLETKLVGVTPGPPKMVATHYW